MTVKAKIDKYTTDFDYKFINDPIYGGIGLSRLEVELINTSYFQRLRHLRQLAYVNYVFPSAEHSRFAHSLGVLAIMAKMAKHLRHKAQEIITPEAEVVLRVAALLHDIGHYPLSHLGEAVYCFHNDLKSFGELVTSPAGNGESQSLLTRINQKPPKKSAHHERLGRFIIEKNEEIAGLLHKWGIEPEQVGAMVTGDPEHSQTVYAQLLHSSLDADRLDYLLRDSYQTGVRYGNVDLDYITRLLEVGEQDLRFQEETKRVKVLCCNKKGQHVIEHYLMSRYFHYAQVIGHKTSLGFESIAKVLFFKLINEGGYIFNSYDEILQKVNSPDLLKLTDATLEHHLDQYYQRTQDAIYKRFYEALKCRERPRTLIEVKDLGPRSNPTNDKYQSLKYLLHRQPEKLEQIIGINKEYIGFYETSVEVETIPAHVRPDAAEKYEKGLREAVRLISSNKEVELLALDDKSLINKTTDLSARTLRVFYVEPNTWADGAAKCEAFRTELERAL